MSVDSGLPDFRNRDTLYKMLNLKKKLEYPEIINPIFFEEHPAKFWYLYGSRHTMYRNAKPHEGYKYLRDLC